MSRMNEMDGWTNCQNTRQIAKKSIQRINDRPYSTVQYNILYPTIVQYELFLSFNKTQNEGIHFEYKQLMTGRVNAFYQVKKKNIFCQKFVEESK